MGDISKFFDIREIDVDEYEPDKGARYHYEQENEEDPYLPLKFDENIFEFLPLPQFELYEFEILPFAY